MTTIPKLPVPKRGVFIVRFPNSEHFHLYKDGEHQHWYCGCDFREVKREAARTTRREIHFIHFT